MSAIEAAFKWVELQVCFRKKIKIPLCFYVPGIGDISRQGAGKPCHKWT